MDASQINILATSLGAAKDIASALIGIRDFNLIAEKTAAIHDQLLQAQDALFRHNTMLFELQEKNFQMAQEIRELREAARQSRRYPLVSVGNGQLAYRVDVSPQECGPSEPGLAQAFHYVCQQCLSRGIESVLQARFERGINIGWRCGNCNDTLLNDEGIKFAQTPIAGPSGVMSLPKI